MKKIYLLFSIALTVSAVFSQSDSLRDYRWQIGFTTNVSNPEYGGTDFNFHEMPVEVSYQERELNFDKTNASICNEEGELLFYTNGIRICNRFGDTITNGNGLNPGSSADANEEWGYDVANGAFVIPDPGSENFYYLIHEGIDYYEAGSAHTSFYFYYTLVDMSTPEGVVISKNNLILQDTFDHGHTTAIRHANGRDWWILKARFDSNEFHTFFVDPLGVHYSYLQSIGNPIDRNGGLSQAVFSPDGTKYARNDGALIAGPQSIKLYDFDRCSGLLSNAEEVIIPDSSWGSGIAFSPNSRYLYSTNSGFAYQFDTEAADLAASKQLIAEWDGEVAPFHSANFFMMQLAPDNKIYVNCNNLVNVMHIIHNPDEPGTACNFEKMGVPLPTYNTSSLPHFPYYKLGTLAGSTCDTLGLSVDAVEEVSKELGLFSIYPNPANDYINIDLSASPDSGRLEIWDVFGKLIWSTQMEKGRQSQQIDINNLTNGVYILSLCTADGKKFSERFVKI